MKGFPWKPASCTWTVACFLQRGHFSKQMSELCIPMNQNTDRNKILDPLRTKPKVQNLILFSFFNVWRRLSSNVPLISLWSVQVFFENHFSPSDYPFGMFWSRQHRTPFSLLSDTGSLTALSEPWFSVLYVTLTEWHPAPAGTSRRAASLFPLLLSRFCPVHRKTKGKKDATAIFRRDIGPKCSEQTLRSCPFLQTCDAHPRESETCCQFAFEGWAKPPSWAWQCLTAASLFPACWSTFSLVGNVVESLSLP